MPHMVQIGCLHMFWYHYLRSSICDDTSYQRAKQGYKVINKFNYYQ